MKNRIDEIRKKEGVNFRYISTNDNPADLATRGKQIDEIRNNSFWWHGPEWINKTENLWPSWNIPEITSEIIDEVKSEVVGPKHMFEMSNIAGEGQSSTDPKGEFPINEEDFSSMTMLLRVTAYLIPEN